ncbi:MAG TPA: hypothetical protein VMF69_23550 [Gemmataceae bacterium]|nr:hypothetical protein [Gemmataceae bacterium]
MDELDFNPDEFVFTEVWLLAEAGHESDALAGDHYLGGPLEDGGHGAFLFTDRDLAERFIVYVGLAGQVVPVQFPDLIEMYWFSENRNFAFESLAGVKGLRHSLMIVSVYGLAV